MVMEGFVDIVGVGFGVVDVVVDIVVVDEFHCWGCGQCYKDLSQSKKWEAIIFCDILCINTYFENYI